MSNSEAFKILMNNAVDGQTIEKLRNKIAVKLESNKKDYLNWTSRPSYVPHKTFDNVNPQSI